MATVRFRRAPGDPVEISAETRGRLASMTDAEIEAAALADPDAQPLTDEQLERGAFLRDLRVARAALGLDLDAFAGAIRISPDVVRCWERGERPDPAARTLLRLLARNPQAVLRLLEA